MKSKKKQKPQHDIQVFKYSISWAVIAFVILGAIIIVS